MSAPNPQPPRGWYVCAAVTHYFAGSRPVCGAPVRPGVPFAMWARGTSPRWQCPNCERAHRALWLAGGPAL